MESLYRVSDMSLIAPLFEGWPENLACSTLDGCMGEAYANPAHTAALVVNGDIAFLAGDAEEILHTYLQDGAGGLGQYAMPGCKGNRGGRRRRLGRRNNCECHQF